MVPVRADRMTSRLVDTVRAPDSDLASSCSSQILSHILPVQSKVQSLKAWPGSVRHLLEQTQWSVVSSGVWWDSEQAGYLVHRPSAVVQWVVLSLSLILY